MTPEGVSFLKRKIILDRPHFIISCPLFMVFDLLFIKISADPKDHALGFAGIGDT